MIRLKGYLGLRSMAVEMRSALCKLPLLMASENGLEPLVSGLSMAVPT